MLGRAVAALLLLEAQAAPAASAVSPPPVITTNAPQLRWSTLVNPSGVFAYRVSVWRSDADPASAWQSGWIFAENEPFPGLLTLDGAGAGGPLLTRGAAYNWTAHELQWQPFPPDAPGVFPTPEWLAGGGAFFVPADLPSPAAEAAAALASDANFSAIVSNAAASVVGRAQPSGFLPTSISGGYGGSTNMFVRDTAAMLIGLLEEGGGSAQAIVRAALALTLDAVVAFNVSYAPHVLTADATLTRIVALDMADQTDGTMHLAAVFARYVGASGDTAFGQKYFPVVARLLNHYVAPGAAAAGGVPYFNQSLRLLFNPNLEHSRLGHYWSTFDVLTNSFAVEALRTMAALASTLGDAAQAAAWEAVRAELLVGLTTSLSYESANETAGSPIYAELIGAVHYWWPGSGNAYPPGNSTGPLDSIYGMSFVNVGVAAAFFNVLGSPGDAPSVAGLDLARLDSTLDTQRRLGSFLWLTDDPAAAALMPTTHINASSHTDPARAVIGKGLGWELAAAAFRGRWARVTTLVRWLGAAAANHTLFGESYDYDCLRTHSAGCYGDMGNGEQTGWFLWGVAVAKKLAAAALLQERTQ